MRAQLSLMVKEVEQFLFPEARSRSGGWGWVSGNDGYSAAGARLRPNCSPENISRALEYKAFAVLAAGPRFRRLNACPFCEQVDFIDQAIELGWVGRNIWSRLSAALRTEGERPEGFFASAWCDVIAWKEV